MVPPTHATVLNEDCQLHYWSQDSGPLILLVPNGFGHGSQYNALMSLLAPNYTIATFDRRGTIGSPNGNASKILIHMQQARDIAAIVKALGFEKATIFGSSLGGNIAVQFAIDFPEMVDLLISHEAPTFSLLPPPFCSIGIEGPMAVDLLYRTAGLDATMSAFASHFQGLGEDGTKMPEPGPRENLENFFKNEFVIGTFYCPDLRKLVQNEVSKRTGLLAGRRSGNALTAKTTVAQQEILECERMVIAGHHFGFECEPEGFKEGLVEMIELLRKK